MQNEIEQLEQGLHEEAEALAQLTAALSAAEANASVHVRTEAPWRSWKPAYGLHQTAWPEENVSVRLDGGVARFNGDIRPRSVVERLLRRC